MCVFPLLLQLALADTYAGSLSLSSFGSRRPLALTMAGSSGCDGPHATAALGQKAKCSLRADIFCCVPNNGHSELERDPPQLERLAILSVACGTGGLAMTTEKRETVSLIGSDKVQGTAVYGPDEEKIGSIARVMIEKISGKVSYAVLSFGGFLGFGDDYYPIPWPSLKYNVDLGGYQTMVPIEKMKKAPKYARNASWDWDSGDRALDEYYGVIPT
jgi:hypothetical protein